MNRRWMCAVLASSACLVAMAGCRGVLGIEDLDVVADGGGVDGGGTTEAAVGDARVDTGAADGSTSVDCSTKGADCARCCHDTEALRPAFEKLAAYAKTSGCICGTNACANECGADLCMGKSGPPAMMTCIPCVDGQIRPMSDAGTPCDQAKKSCGPDSTCKPFLDCITSCKQ